MSYKLYTVRDNSGQDEHQWEHRSSLEDELQICDQRTLAGIFETYLPKDGPIIEAGCGLGSWVKWLNNHGWPTIGIDRYPDIVARAQQLGIDVRAGDITHLREFQDGEFAGYVSLGVIEHFEEGPAAAVREALRVLRPGGIAIFTTPASTLLRSMVVHPMRSTAVALLRASGRKTFFGEYRFSLAELQNHLRQGGFEIVAHHLDDMKPEDKERHIGLFADFPFFRDHSGAWRLNGLGRTALGIARHILPRSAYASANCVVARRPAA